jgi:Uma2 family endonuclease
MTFRREDLERGLEPDECFWIRSEPLVRGRLNLDFGSDPPPDVAIEVEITHAAVDRLALYAALRVPEVWHYDTTRLRVGLLQPDGQYRWDDASPTFPMIPLAEVPRFLRQWQTTDHLSIVRAFRAWAAGLVASRG